MKTLTFYSGKLWSSDKPFPVKPHPGDYAANVADQGVYIRDKGRYHRESNDWLSTAYEVVNPEVIPQIDLMDGLKNCDLNDGDQITLPEGYGIKKREDCASDICDTDGQCEHCREPKTVATITLPEKPQLPGDYNHAKRAIRDELGNVTGFEAFNPCVKSQKPLAERLDSVSEKIKEKPENSAHGYTEPYRLLKSKDHEEPFYFNGHVFRNLGRTLVFDKIRNDGDYYTVPTYVRVEPSESQEDTYKALLGKQISYRYVDWEEGSFSPWQTCTDKHLKAVFQDASVDIIQFKP